jgi:hypothetical protein
LKLRYPLKVGLSISSNRQAKIFFVLSEADAQTKGSKMS